MIKRGLLIGTYDTVADGLWTLTGLELAPAVPVMNYVDVPGRRKGPLDLSTVLTDGDPYYGSRNLTATFESSEGNRMEREDRISDMINSLDGYIQEIKLPDDSERHVVGRVHVERLYNDPSHCSVRVTAVCEPWRYNNTETSITLTASGTVQRATLPNLGRLAVVPVLTVTGSEVQIVQGGSSWALSAGSYTLPELLIPAGGLTISYSGTGSLAFTYREAVL